MIYNKQQIQDAARFSNFAQKFKMIVWEKEFPRIKEMDSIREHDLDEIALELWDWLKKEKK